jgi:hypothetical protein
MVLVFMTGQKTTRRQKDISRLLREKKYNQPQKSKKDNAFPVGKQARQIKGVTRHSTTTGTR